MNTENITAEKWSGQAWGAIAPIFEKITAHPFLTALTEGTLERAKFIFYLQQDALYLDDFGKVLAGLAVKCVCPRQSADFLKFAGEALAVERELHRVYLSGAEARPVASPACLLYTSYMHRQLAIAPLEVAVAAVLPCFWIYQAVGDYILAAARRPDHPYRDWIETYGGQDYALVVTRAVVIADELAEASTPASRREMTLAFEMAARMEWMFWDSAWRLELWPV